MKTIEQYLSDPHEFNSFHDCVAEAIDTEYLLTRSTLLMVFNSLPEHVQATGLLCGISDTVLRDQTYVYLRNTRAQ